MVDTQNYQLVKSRKYEFILITILNLKFVNYKLLYENIVESVQIETYFN